MIANQRVVAVVQARMGSSRLPGKVLLPLANRPVLWHILERLDSLAVLDEIVLATSREPQDDSIARFADYVLERQALRHPFRLFRGAHEDVLARFYQALEPDPPELVVRVTADTPLIATCHLQRMIEHLVYTGVDGVDAHHGATGLTLGFGAEVYRYQALKDAHLLAMNDEEREHVSLFIKRRPQAFAVHYLKPSPELCSEHRLTLDTDDDYRRLAALFEAHYRPGQPIDCRALLRALEAQRQSSPLTPRTQ